MFLYTLFSVSAVKLISSTIHVTAIHILMSVAGDRIPERQNDNMTSQSITSVMEEVTNHPFNLH